MVYVKMVNIVTLMASIGVIKKRERKLKWTNPLKSWADPFTSLLELHQFIGKSFQNHLKDIVIIIVHLCFSERFDVFLVIQVSFSATLGPKRAL